MKRTILFALIAVMFLAMFTGCRAYRRNHTFHTAPGHTITNHDGRTTTNRGFHYRTDGSVSNGHRATDGRVATRDNRLDGHMNGHGFRHDGRVTDHDGIIGNGTHADRPAGLEGYRAERGVSPYGIGRPGTTTGMNGVVGTPTGSGTIGR